MAALMAILLLIGALVFAFINMWIVALILGILFVIFESLAILEAMEL